MLSILKEYMAKRFHFLFWVNEPLELCESLL